METLIPLLAGLVLLVAGRRIYWFVLIVLGFTFGMKVTPLLLEAPTQSTLLMISVAFGLLSALLAFVIQKIAIGATGFLLGAYAAFIAMQRLGATFGKYSWIPMICCGLLGVVLATKVFEWALIFISSLSGAYLVATSLGLSTNFENVLFLVVCAAGIFIQSKSLLSGGSKRETKPNKRRNDPDEGG